MKVLFALFIALSIAYAGNIRNRLHYEYAFQQYTRENNKNYPTSDEYVYRLQVFADNMDKIEEHNSKASSYKLGLNRFADLTEAEFERSIESGSRSKSNANKKQPVKTNAGEIPTEIDWTTKGAVSQVKDQGACGSCWAFSVTGALESAYYLKNKVMLDLSEQELVDCSGSYGNQGCNGGLEAQGYRFVADKGLCSQVDYPYHAKDESCKTTCKSVISTSGYVQIPEGEAELAEAVSLHPVSVAVNASPIQLYKSGIFTGSCSPNLNHAVLGVGYGAENGVKFWKIKNSWGKKWGEEGYFRLLKDNGSAGGLCGCALDDTYPTL